MLLGEACAAPAKGREKLLQKSKHSVTFQEVFAVVFYYLNDTTLYP